MARARTIKQTFKQSKNDDASRRGKARAIAWKRIGDRASEEDDEGEVEKDLRELKQFDLTMKYGPCTGMTRLERYDRAVANGLAPPPRVLEIIHRRGSDGRWTECLWYGTAVDML